MDLWLLQQVLDAIGRLKFHTFGVTLPVSSKWESQCVCTDINKNWVICFCLEDSHTD